MQDLITPAVAAAIVSALALLVRELIARRGSFAKLQQDRQQIEGDLAVRGQEMLLKQIEGLWAENASVKTREAEGRARCRVLEQQVTTLEQHCRELEAQIEQLRRRLDRHDRLLPGPSASSIVAVGA